MPVPHEYRWASGRITWKVRFRFRGEQCQETFDTEKAALAFCSDIATRDVHYALRVLETEREADALSVDDLAGQFLTWKASDPDVRSDRTVADYRRDYRNWVGPTFGRLPASVVDEKMVQEWVDAMSAGTLGRKPASPKSIADRHMILHGMYAWGMAPARKLVNHNPCTATRLPKRRKAPPKGLRPAEWHALYAALAQIDQDAADFAEFMLATSWRVSEAAALSAYDVEDDGITVHVHMGRVLRRNAAGQHVIVEDAKSEAGLRRARLDPQAADMVRRRLDRVHGDGLVFTTQLGNQWHYSNFLNRFWNPAVKAAGLSRKPTPHWLRHTAVFWLVAGKQTSLAEIQRRVGHENISTTIGVYGRMVDDISDDALDAFAAMRRPVNPPSAAPPVIADPLGDPPALERRPESTD
jgi:integrase